MRTRARTIRPVSFKARALSLPEILVVVAIIAILGAAVVIVARGALGSSKEKQTVLTMKVLENVLTTYKGERKRFPTDPYVLAFGGLGKPRNGRKLMGDKLFPAAEAKFRRGTIPGSYVKEEHEPNHWPTDEGHAFGEFAELLTVMMQSAECKKTINSLEAVLIRRKNFGGPNPERYVWAVVDAWGHEFLYRISEHENNGFPILLSAGPDETYATVDDIRSDGKHVEVAP